MNATFWRPYRFWQGRLPQGEWWGVSLYMKVYDVQTFSLRNWEKNIAIRAKRMYSIQFYLWQWGTHFSATYRSEMCSTKSIKTFEHTFFKETDMKCAIYCRVSSTGERQSNERQVRDLKAYADANHMDVAKIFEEKISGGVKNSERTVLNQCFAYCLDNNIDILLISELSRLGRKVDEVLANIRYCKEHHLNIYFQKEGFAIYSRSGKENAYLTIMIAVLGTAAEMERSNIQYRLNSGRAKYIAAGGRLGKPKGSGVKSREKKREEYKTVLRLLRQGYSIRKTAKICSVGISTVQRLKKEFF